MQARIIGASGSAMLHTNLTLEVLLINLEQAWAPLTLISSWMKLILSGEKEGSDLRGALHYGR
jgi:hypothetical protein